MFFIEALLHRHKLHSRAGAAGQPATKAAQSGLSSLLLVAGSGLFALVALVLLWPQISDGTAPATSGVIEASDVSRDIKGDWRGSPNQAPAARSTPAERAPMSLAQCRQRRDALAQESRTVDRYDLDAVGNLNIRIGLFNTDCTAGPAPHLTDDRPRGSVIAGALSGGQVNVPQETAVPPKEDPPAASEQSVAVGQAPTRGADRTPSGSTGASGGALRSKAQADRQTTNGAASAWNPTVLSVQSLLTKLGYQPGPSDGLMGRRTQAAVRAFQRQAGLPVDGLVTLELLEAVLAAYPGHRPAATRSAAGPTAGANAATATPDSTKPVLDPAITVAPDAVDDKARDRLAEPAPNVTEGTDVVIDPMALNRPEPAPAPEPSTPQSVRDAGAHAAADQTQAAAALPDSPAVTVATDGDHSDVNSDGNRQRPDDPLDGLSQFERQTVQWVCASRGNGEGDPAVRACLSRQIEQARVVGKPNLATLLPFERSAIVRLCANDRYEKGLAAYYQCARKQQASLAQVERKPNMSLLSANLRATVRRNCDGLQFTESLPVYYRCVDSQVRSARR